MNVEALRASVSGAVILPAEAGYPAARARLLWNARKPRRNPAVIVRAASVADVQAVVRFARDHRARVSVRGGGHHWSGIALQEGIVLDVSGLNRLNIDPRLNIARAGPGVTGRQLARSLARHGRAFPVGHCAPVCLSGYLLGGGFGCNTGTWGIACFSIESLDVVTADGELRCASEAENADIFWAARGAGPAFFAVVTEYRLRLQPLPAAITTSTFTYALDDIGKVERWMSAALPGLPRNVEFTVSLSTAPPHVAERAGRCATAVATVFADSDAEARCTLATIAAAAPPGAIAADWNRPTPFEAVYDTTSGFFADGRYGADTFWSAAAPAQFLDALAERVRCAPSPRSLALGVILPPPAPDAPPMPDAAFSMIARTCGFCYAVWPDAADDDANLRWLRETGEILAPMTAGHYVGEADLEQPGRLRGSFAPAAWEKIEALRARYDPAGLFRRDDS